MTDLELLRRYEPVVRFATGERFHPLAVESYLERCDLFERRRGLGRWIRRRKVTLSWDDSGAADVSSQSTGARRADALDGFDAFHFLRFLDRKAWKRARREQAQDESPELKAPWLGLIMLPVLIVAGILVVKQIFGLAWAGPVWAIGITAVVFLLTGFQIGARKRYGAKEARGVLEGAMAVAGLVVAVWAWTVDGTSLRLIVGLPAAMMALGGLAAWIVRLFSDSAARVLRLAAILPPALVVIYWIASSVGGTVAAVALVSAVLLMVLLAFGENMAAALLALLSPLRRAARDQAATIEATLRKDSKRDLYPYYGRVWRHPEGSQIVLQYFFFYAFNDWRGQGGINFHEADWEGVMVFLTRHGEKLEPREVVALQHHGHDHRDWNEAELVDDHPVLYVAVGSHATYLNGGRKDLRDLVRGRFGKWLTARVASFRTRSETAAREGRDTAGKVLGREPEEVVDRSVADIADGEGIVVGPVRPPEVAAKRHKEWSPVVVGDGVPWIDFEGLWGLRTLLKNESGPPGPKWKREEDRARGESNVRLAWSDPPAWLKEARSPAGSTRDP